MSRTRKVAIGDRVTCRVSVEPYSRTAHDYDGRTFAPGMTGEVIARPDCVTLRRCAICATPDKLPGGVAHREFWLVEFKRHDGTYDRVALSLCNAVSV